MTLDVLHSVSLDLVVKTEKKTYVAGDTVRGTVEVHVDKKRTEGTPAKDVVLKMRGVATTRVRFLSDYAKGSKSKLKYSEYADNFPEERKFFSFDLPLASFEGGVAGPGVHTVPFAVVLPEVLPSSTLVRGTGGGSGALSYHVKARLDRPGLLNFAGKAETGFKVVGVPRGIAAGSHTAVTVGPTTHVMKNLFWKKIGIITMAIQVDRTAIRPGETLGVTVLGRNDCTADVRGMQMQLVQHIRWIANAHVGKNKRVIASMSAPGAKLGKLAYGVKSDDSDGHTDEEIADDAKADLNSSITVAGSSLESSGDSLRHELTIPKNPAKKGNRRVNERDALLETLDYDAALGLPDGAVLKQVQVNHALEVTLKTCHGITDPVWSVPLWVQPVMPDEVEAEPLFEGRMVPVAPDMSYTAAGALDDQGFPEAVLIPEDALETD